MDSPRALSYKEQLTLEGAGRSDTSRSIAEGRTMRNFIMLFTEKEGTSPILRVLDALPGLAVIHQAENKGWEPFDPHNCGSMTNSDLLDCIDTLLAPGSPDWDRLNAVYTRTAARPLEPVDPDHARGFKHRVRPSRLSPLDHGLEALDRSLTFYRAASSWFYRDYRRRLFEVLARHEVVVFMAVRQDIFRWALSKYHGDGTGRRGHLQFKVASGNLKRDEIPRIEVNPQRFERLLRRCEIIHEIKRNQVEELRALGVTVYPSLYETFVEDPVHFFQGLVQALGAEVDAATVNACVQEHAYFKKVHSDDISEFVINHEETMERFGHRFISW